jgi:hypothetical protein
VLPGISHDRPDDSDLDVPSAGEQLARAQAIKQIGRRRRFWFWAMLGALFMVLLTVIWAVAQYHTAGGWPPVPNVWNGWIIWPAMVWALATAGYAWFVFGNRPVPESEIKREMQRQAGLRR